MRIHLQRLQSSKQFLWHYSPHFLKAMRRATYNFELQTRVFNQFIIHRSLYFTEIYFFK
jgi:hypothetical protein